MLNGNNIKGFTLPELLIGIFIFTTSVISINAMLISSIKNNASNYRINKAVNIAETKMENLKNSDINKLKQGNYQETNKTEYGAYNIEWKITDIPPSAKKIAVSVTDKTEKPVNLQTLINCP